VTRIDGYLVFGAAETVVGLTDAFEPTSDQRGLYVPTPMARRMTGIAIGPKPQRVVTLARAR
jgi:chemotaxis protein methyltransferase CheR